MAWCLFGIGEVDHRTFEGQASRVYETGVRTWR